MRRMIITAAGAVLAGTLLAGCSSGPSDDEKKYADAAAAADPDDFGGIPTDDLADTLGSEGADLCAQLKKGSYESAVAFARTGFSEKEAAALVAAAVLVECPDQKAKLPAS
ncbi:hypothetical protein OG345_40765 (plasmid) [Streptomyces sp. NBC_01220]|uniref:hypothetical protein n=1 Tax=Streptomyces sp. NBC_01220 TaxID=2903781 RepID=UPI00352D99FC|nr:hypothetical protein OG345_40765 [Streptomyces sp. NBC_01220]